MSDLGFLSVPSSSGTSTPPKVVHINPLIAPLASSGSWSTSIDPNQYFNHRRYTTSAADGSHMSWWSDLGAGTWTLDLFTRTSTDYGKLDVEASPDGTSWTTLVSGIDAYVASASQLISTTTGIVIALTGPLRVRVKVNGKNAASSSYNAAINWLTFTRTST